MTARRARFAISAPALPACEFASRDALLANVHDALHAQALLDQLNHDGEADAFAIDAQACGMFDAAEIDAAVRTRRLPATLYA